MENTQSKAVLNSWKEIAVFFERGVRTVQRWERELGLPVHRVRGTDHSPVFAYTAELRLWLQARSAETGPVLPPMEPRRPDQGDRSRIHENACSEAERSWRLTRELASLVIEQRNRAQMLVHNLQMAVAGLRERRMRRSNGDRDLTQGAFTGANGV